MEIQANQHLKTKIKLFNNNKNNKNYGEIKVKGLNLFSYYWKNTKCYKKSI